jgi:hypothetical protein
MSTRAPAVRSIVALRLGRVPLPAVPFPFRTDQAQPRPRTSTDVASPGASPLVCPAATASEAARRHGDRAPCGFAASRRCHG